MRNVISRDRVSWQFRAAADAALGIAIQEDKKEANSIVEIPAHATGEEGTLMADRPEINSPGEVVDAAARQLGAAGFDTRVAAPGNGRHLTIVHAGCARCELVIEDDGSVRWEYRPASSRDTDPAVVTQVVLLLLASDDVAATGTSTDLGITLKAAVGRALDAHGLEVRMLVYEDLIFYDVTAEVVVSNPARPDRGQVRLGDDGNITWECSCRDMVRMDAEEIANSLVGASTEAIAPSQSIGRSQGEDLR